MTNETEQNDPLGILKKNKSNTPASEPAGDPLGILKKKDPTGSVESTNTGAATSPAAEPVSDGLNARQRLKRNLDTFVRTSQESFNMAADAEHQRLQSEVQNKRTSPQDADKRMQQFLDAKEKEYNQTMSKWFDIYNTRFEKEDFEENKERNPLYSAGKTAWTTLTKDLPASFFSTRALTNSAFNKMDEQLKNAVDRSGIQISPSIQEKAVNFLNRVGSSITGIPEEQIAKNMQIPADVDRTGRSLVLKDVKKSIELSKASAEQKKYLVNSLDKVKDGDYLDWVNYAASAVGQGVGQIPASAFTKGTSSLVQQMGNIYMDALQKIAQDESERKGVTVTIEDVIKSGKDDVVYPLLAGIGSGLLDAVGAKAVAGAGKDLLLNSFRKRALALGSAALEEAGTEFNQSILEQIGVNKAAGQTWGDAIRSIDPKQLAENALQGGIAGLFLGGISSAANAFMDTRRRYEQVPTVQIYRGVPASIQQEEATINPEDNAVQEQSTDEVPIQPAPGDSEAVAEGVPEPGQEELAGAQQPGPEAGLEPAQPALEEVAAPAPDTTPLVEEPVSADQAPAVVEAPAPVAPEAEPIPTTIEIDAPKKKNKNKPARNVGSQEGPTQELARPTDTELPIVEDNPPPAEEQPAKTKSGVAEGETVDFEWLGERRTGKVLGTNDRGLYRIQVGKTVHPVEPSAIIDPNAPASKEQKHQENLVKPKDETETIQYNSRRKKPIGIVSAGPNFLIQTDLGKKIKNFFQKEFVPRGHLPMTAFKRWHQAAAEIAKHGYEVDTTVRDTAKAAREIYGKNITNEQVTEMNRYLSGNKKIDLPDNIKHKLDVMRAQVDNMSRAMIDHGVVSGPMVDTFTKNLGSYLRRSYRKFDDPEWAEFVPDEVKNKAYAFIRDNAQFAAQRKFAKATRLKQRAGAKQQLIDRLNKRIEKLSKPFDDDVNDRITPKAVRDTIEAELPKVLALRKRIATVEKRDYNKLYEKWKQRGEKAMAEGNTKAAMEAFTRATKSQKLGDTKEARLKQMRDRLKDIEKPFEERVSASMKPETLRKMIEERYDRIEKIRNQIQNIEARDLDSEAEQAMEDAQKAYNISDEEIQGLINYLLYNPESPAAAMGKGGKLGSKDLSILQRRGDIAPEIRALLGEYSDPLLNYARSMMGMANLMAKQRFLDDVRAEGLGKWLFTKPTGEYSAPIAAQGSKTMSPLNLYTKPEIADAFNSFLQNDKYPSWFMRTVAAANAIVKTGKTVLSPITQVGNILGNLYFMVGNGYAFGGQEIATGAKTTPKAIFSAIASNYTTNEKIREYYKHLVGLGVVRNGSSSAEFQEILKDVRNGKESFERLLSGDNAVKRTKNNILKGANNLYQAGDDLFKIIAFEVEKARYKSAFPDMEEAQIERIAADIVQNLLPTYSRTPKIIQRIRVNPLVGSFVSFPAEVIRTVGNTYSQAFRELKDPRTRGIGAKRLAGIMMANTISTSMKLFGLWALGMSWEDDEKFRKVTSAPWNGNSEYFYLGRNGDEYSVMDLSFRDPYAMLKRPLYDLFSDENPARGVGKAVQEFLQPFISEEILFSKIEDITRNQDTNGRQVYNPDTDLGDIGQDIYSHLYEAFEPGFARFGKRLKKGLNEETDAYGNTAKVGDALFELSGQRIERRNVSQAFQFKIYDVKKRILDTKTEYNREILRPSATPEEIEKAKKRFGYAMRRIARDANELYLAAISLGTTPNKADEIVGNAKDPFIGAAIEGTVEEYLADYEEAKDDDREEKLDSLDEE